jgi:hypothetical protein
MKNTLTISITKYYTFKSSAETMDVAFDEYLNTTPAKVKYKTKTIEPVVFSVWTPKKRKPYKKYQHKG